MVPSGEHTTPEEQIWLVVLPVEPEPDVPEEPVVPVVPELEVPEEPVVPVVPDEPVAPDEPSEPVDPDAVEFAEALADGAAAEGDGMVDGVGTVVARMV